MKLGFIKELDAFQRLFKELIEPEEAEVFVID